MEIKEAKVGVKVDKAAKVVKVVKVAKLILFLVMDGSKVLKADKVDKEVLIQDKEVMSQGKFHHTMI